MKRPARLLVLAALVASLLLLLAAVPATGKSALSERAFTHVSQSVAIRHWLANPDQAPEQLRSRFRQASEALSAAGAERGSESDDDDVEDAVEDLFNRDDSGLPQNEESITVCRSDPDIVLGSTNDFRGLFDPEGNITGWHLSTDGGDSVENEGLLPPVHLQLSDVDRPSGGDPVTVADADCNLYGGSLNYDPEDPFHLSNGIGVYRSDADTLASCPGGSHPSCWPVRRAVAEAEASHFLDKEWIHVGESGSAGTVVWAVYADFTIDDTAPLGFTGASVKAVRCSADLTSCTSPILISGSDPDIQFADVTVGPDERTYVTWSEIVGELPDDPEFPEQTFIHKLRIAPAGSTEFGATQVIASEPNALAFSGFLHANDFRNATYPKHEVMMVEDDDDEEHPRIFVAWDGCAERLLAFICEEPEIKLTSSDDDGATWSDPLVLSAGGDNYFPTISGDPESGLLALAWFTNRFDPAFHNRQDVEMVSVDSERVRIDRRERVTRVSNESEADPLLGGFFIGDYIEVFAHDRTAWVHYNANFRQIELLGLGFPIPQQDNFLAKVRM